MAMWPIGVRKPSRSPGLASARLLTGWPSRHCWSAMRGRLMPRRLYACCTRPEQSRAVPGVLPANTYGVPSHCMAMRTTSLPVAPLAAAPAASAVTLAVSVPAAVGTTLFGTEPVEETVVVAAVVVPPLLAGPAAPGPPRGGTGGVGVGGGPPKGGPGDGGGGGGVTQGFLTSWEAG